MQPRLWKWSGGAGAPHGGAARPPNGAPGAAGRACSGPGERGIPPAGKRGWPGGWEPVLRTRTATPCVRQLSVAGSAWPLAGAAVGSWARERPLSAQPGVGNEALPLLACPRERDGLCWQDTNNPSPGMMPHLLPVTPAPWEAFL